MANIWLKFVIVLLTVTAATVRAEGLDENLQNPGYLPEPAWFKSSFLDIREDVAEAAAEGKRVLLYFHQDGCPYCKKLIQDNFGQKQTAEFAQKHFDTVSINMWGDREVTGFDGELTTEKQFARTLKVQFTPTMLLLDEKGQKVLSINGYYPPAKFLAALEFVGLAMERETDFRSWYRETALTEASGKLHVERWFLRGPLDLTRSGLHKSNKPMLVLFEQKQCLACDELHTDILQRSETRELFRQFDVAVVDRWSNELLTTPDGETIPAMQWAAAQNINYSPALVFFDPDGQEVFRTEAWLKNFHIQSALVYVLQGAYSDQPEFQRFVEARADHMREQGLEVNLMD